MQTEGGEDSINFAHAYISLGLQGAFNFALGFAVLVRVAKCLAEPILTAIEKRYFPSNFIFLSHSELYSHNNKIAAALCIVKYNIFEEEIASNRGSECGRERMN